MKRIMSSDAFFHWSNPQHKGSMYWGDFWRRWLRFTYGR